MEDQKEITENERRRMTKAVLFLQASSFIMTVLVVVFFVYAQQSSSRDRADAKAFIERLSSEMEARIETYGELRAANAVLERESQRLGDDLEMARGAEADLRTEMRRQLLAMDREKNELKARIKLLEDAMEAGGEAQEKDPETAGFSPPEGELTPVTKLLNELNRFYSGYSTAGLQFVDGSGFSGQTLEAPVLRLDDFMDRGAAALMLDRVTFSFIEGKVEMTGFGGRYSTDKGEQGTVPDTGMRLAMVPLVEEEQELSLRLQSLFGMPLPVGEESPLSIDEGENPTAEVVQAKLNHLLMLERGEKYRFRTIGSIKGSHLLDVELEQTGNVQSLNHLVIAETCEVVLMKEHGYVEFLFHNGYLVQDSKQKPFYNDSYRLPIPNIHRNYWLEAGLRCLVIK